MKSGLTKDYYIAMGVFFKNQYEFPLKKFYFCTDSFVFSVLPPLITKHKNKVDEFRTYFSGQLEKVLVMEIDPENPNPDPVQADPTDPQDPLDDSLSEPEVVEEKINLTELDRLSYVVQSIEIDCAVVPVGSLKLTPTHEIRYDNNFRGLSLAEANQIENYMHFRQPLTPEKQEYICNFSQDKLPLNQIRGLVLVT